MLTKKTLAVIARRTRQHGTKARIARDTNIPLAYLSRILSGKSVPSQEKANLLEDALGIPASEFRRSAR
jgi:transcriptional regulator with XRE-family HTH domain